MLNNKLFISIFLILTFFTNANAQKRKSVPFNIEKYELENIPITGIQPINASNYLVFKIDIQAISTGLEGVTYREGALNGFVGEILLPFADGSLHKFSVKRNQTMHPKLGEKFPEIVTFDAYALDGSGAFAKWDITPHGLHAMIMIPGESTVFIDPLFKGNTDFYMVYRRSDFITDKTKLCGVVEAENTQKPSLEKLMFGTCELRTYRLALAASGEYSIFHGGTTTLALAAQVTSMNRVNGVYEKDIAITMVIVPNNNLIVYTATATDPYTNGTPGTMITQNQTTCDNLIGSANYDIGHVFGTNSGGLAGLGVVCAGGQKARGVTGSAAPVGDPFDIDYVAHEMGHQFGGNHTQNNNCNSVTAARREPGSASTIMGYAGICAPNVQNNSDDYFHGYNLGEISSEILSGGHQCEVLTALNNTPPVIVSTGGNIIVPISTPFVLTGNATDVDGDVLTYLWEQMDNEASTQPPVANATGGPSFRSFDPTTNPSRYFPNLTSLASNGPFTWEVLPSVARVMDFRLTVKDNHSVGSCNAYTDITVTTNASAGPFVVTYPSATGISWVGGSTQTVTWAVANTTAAPINCANVKILLSVNGGQSYPYVLATTTTNDGTEVITVPNVPSTTARVMVISSAETFYDISNYNFTITCGSFETPVFTGIGPICQYDSTFTLPLVSNNSISGTWLPLLSTTTVGDTNYIFTPESGTCAVDTTITLSINPYLTPSFSSFSDVCENAPAPQFPTLSNNGVVGTWSPAVTTTVIGATNYLFTPNSGQCSEPYSQSLQVIGLPNVQVTQNGITLTVNLSGAEYQWIDCSTGLPVSGANAQSFTTSEIMGSYAAIVTSNGCSDTSNCFDVDQSGISSESIEVSILPNPFNDKISINWGYNPIQIISLIDASGKKVLTLDIKDIQEYNLDLSTFKKGVYFLRLNGESISVTHKLIKL